MKNMKNALVSIDYRLNLPEAVVKRILERSTLREDDGSDGWYRSACEVIEEAVADDPAGYLDYVTDEPEIEVDA